MSKVIKIDKNYLANFEKKEKLVYEQILKKYTEWGYILTEEKKEIIFIILDIINENPSKFPHLFPHFERGKGVSERDY